MSLELDALSFRVIVESDLNVDGMLIEPGKEIRNHNDAEDHERVTKCVYALGPPHIHYHITFLFQRSIS